MRTGRYICERALIGAFLTGQRDEREMGIAPEFFCHEQTREIFECIQGARAKTGCSDPLVVGDELARLHGGRLPQGWMDELIDMADDVVGGI